MQAQSLILRDFFYHTIKWLPEVLRAILTVLQ